MAAWVANRVSSFISIVQHPGCPVISGMGHVLFLVQGRPDSIVLCDVCGVLTTCGHSQHGAVIYWMFIRDEPLHM